MLSSITGCATTREQLEISMKDKSDNQPSRRGFLKTLSYVAPTILTLQARPAFAMQGSSSTTQRGGSSLGDDGGGNSLGSGNSFGRGGDSSGIAIDSRPQPRPQARPEPQTQPQPRPWPW